MPQRFVVPQFIDSEDKIMGPLTTRQFLILLVTCFLMFIEYKLADFTLFLLIGIPTFLLGAALAFFKVNGNPVHLFLLNLVQTSRRPVLRVWDKEIELGEVRALMAAPPPKPPPPKIYKEAIEESRLAELSLIVNTGGVYKPEE